MCYIHNSIYKLKHNLYTINSNHIYTDRPYNSSARIFPLISRYGPASRKIKTVFLKIPYGTPPCNSAFSPAATGISNN